MRFAPSRLPRRRNDVGYLTKQEAEERLSRVRELMAKHDLQLAMIYYDEFNIGNGWYLTGWCPQFESGAVLVPREGEPMILGGPESEPFAKLDSAITETRNFSVFMVPNEEYPNAEIIDFPRLFKQLNRGLGKISRVGLVGGGRMPAACYSQIIAGFNGTKLVDITDEFVAMRFTKSDWEISQIRSAFRLADDCYDAMKRKIAAGVSEIEVAAVGEFSARSAGASGFGFGTIVGSGPRSNAVVPTASSRRMKAGESVMIGIAPKVNGYAGVVGDTLPVSGEYTPAQRECMKHLKEAFRLAREQMLPGTTAAGIDTPPRRYFEKHGLSQYLVCPFCHTIGLHEAESPFFGPTSRDILTPGMTVCIDISFFGHPEFNGARIETGYVITETGAEPLSPKMDKLFTT